MGEVRRGVVEERGVKEQESERRNIRERKGRYNIGSERM